jgi:formylglycine-generating enzyme required for sulfatase activity
MTKSQTNSQDSASFGGDFQGTYIGRDQIILIQGYTGEQLELVLAQLRQLLSSGRAAMQANLAQQRLTITAPDAPTITLSDEAAKSLLPVAARQASERSYLTALTVHPRYGRWATQFVPLAGMLTDVNHPSGWGDLAPEYTLLQMEGQDAQQRIQRVRLDDITQALDAHPALALLGEPGAGKSTALYKLALDAAQVRLTAIDNGKLPLLLELADYRAYATPFAFVQDIWRKRIGVGADLTEQLRKGNLLLLFDALNEMPFENMSVYREKVAAFNKFVQAWPGNIFIFTCRSRDYSEPMGLPQVEIERLSDERIQSFLEKRLETALAEQSWAKLAETPLLELVRNPYYLNMLAYLVAQGQQWPASRAALFQGFVNTLIERERHKKHPGWPRAQAQKGAAALTQAFNALAGQMQPIGAGTRLPRTSAIAHMPSKVVIQGETISLDPAKTLDLGLAATLLDTEPGADDQEQAKFYHHQLQEYFSARYLLARFDAGESMAAHWQQPRTQKEMPSHGELGPSEPLPPPPPTGWEEPTILAAGLSALPGKFLDAVRALNPVLAARCLLEPGLPELPAQIEAAQSALLGDMGDRHIHLRARLTAGDALGNLDDPRFEEVMVDGERVLLPPLVEIPGGSLNMGSTRWQVWRLGRSGFSANAELPQHTVTVAPFQMGRYPVTNAEMRCFWAAGGYEDEHYWPTAAAKAWRRGEDTEDKAQSEFMQSWRALQENPEQIIDNLSRQGRNDEEIQVWEQVANMDEAQALELIEGHYSERDRSQPDFWDDERFNNPSQPVVGVTWYESLAYCTWLGEKLAAVSGERLVLSKGEGLANVKFSTAQRSYWQRVADGELRVTLPSEAQWEYAARGLATGSGRVYPWGRRFSAERANTYEGRVLRPSPVGVYPQGISDSGLHDLSGSVWEWTASLYQQYPYQDDDGRNDLESAGRRVLRGGSWSSTDGFARCAFRNWVLPSYFDNGIGFRLLLSLAGSDF